MITNFKLFRIFKLSVLAGLFLFSFYSCTQSRGIKIKKITLSTGVELEYAEKGNKKGTPVLFLHGFSDSWHSFEQVLNLMPDDLHCIALSQRGQGNSSQPEEGYHPKDFAADIAAFIRQQNLGQCIIAGHSMGGLIAQQFAIDHPRLVKALIFIDSDASFADNKSMIEFGDEVMKLEDPIAYSFAEAFQRSTISKPVDRSMLNLWISESMKLTAQVWKSIYEGIMAVNYTGKLQTITAPVLIFWGTNDAICFKSDEDNLVQNIKKTKFIVYEDTGHALHWEEPQRFVNDLVDFIHSNFSGR